jgi:hypothetical protein
MIPAVLIDDDGRSEGGAEVRPAGRAPLPAVAAATNHQTTPSLRSAGYTCRCRALTPRALMTVNRSGLQTSHYGYRTTCGPVPQLAPDISGDDCDDAAASLRHRVHRRCRQLRHRIRLPCWQHARAAPLRKRIDRARIDYRAMVVPQQILAVVQARSRPARRGAAVRAAPLAQW